MRKASSGSYKDVVRKTVDVRKPGPGGRTIRTTIDVVNKRRVLDYPIKIIGHIGDRKIFRPTTSVIDPDPSSNPASEGFPGSGFGPGLNPEVTITVIGPGGIGSGDTPAITVTPTPDTPPGTGYNRRKACLVGLVIVVDDEGNVTYSAASRLTTNNLDLVSLLTSAGLKPSTAGTYQFTFEFFGWRRQQNNLHSDAWINDDTMYKIYNEISEPVYTVFT